MASIHNRMPVILQDNQFNSRLDPTASDPRKLTQLLQPPSEDFLQCHPVSKERSSSRIDERACGERIDLFIAAPAIQASPKSYRQLSFALRVIRPPQPLMSALVSNAGMSGNCLCRDKALSDSQQVDGQNSSPNAHSLDSQIKNGLI